MLIRRELASDHAVVGAILTDAFADQAPPGTAPVEVALVEVLRRDAAWIPQLALVAEDADGVVVGCVYCTRGELDGRPALGLGPVAVAKKLQGTGVGSALMHAVLAAADAMGESVVVLLGHRDYYQRFGFVPASELGILPPQADWASHFQARKLVAWEPSLTGVFSYPQPFNEL